MLWYVIQTYTGREENLIRMVRRMVPRELYGDCFVAYHEQLRHRQQENRIHVERIFPGYVFVTSAEPEKLFLFLKNVPAMSKMMADGEFYFLPLDTAEARFLADIMDENHVIRLSYVATDGKDHVSYVSGPLSLGTARVTRYHFRLRYALVRLALAGEEKEIRMGIVLNDDVRRELQYGKVEAPIKVPDKYRVPAQGMAKGGRTEEHAPESVENAAAAHIPLNAAAEDADRVKAAAGRKAATGGNPTAVDFKPGDAVIVVSGALAGVPARVFRVQKNCAVIGVHLFDRDAPMKVQLRDIARISS